MLPEILVSLISKQKRINKKGLMEQQQLHLAREFIQSLTTALTLTIERIK